jgi:hypothetical protein
MERRRHERLSSEFDASLTDIVMPSHTAPGRVIDISESGVCVEVSLDFSVGATVKLALRDCTLFGHVAHCSRNGDKYRVGIDVVRVLIGDSDLGRLVNSILAESMPHTPGVKADTE